MAYGLSLRALYFKQLMGFCGKTVLNVMEYIFSSFKTWCDGGCLQSNCSPELARGLEGLLGLPGPGKYPGPW